MLSNDSWDLAHYHQQDLMAEAQGERLVAMLPARRSAWARHAVSVRQRLARACYRLANWLDAPSPRLGADTCAEDWSAPIARA